MTTHMLQNCQNNRSNENPLVLFGWNSVVCYQKCFFTAKKKKIKHIITHSMRGRLPYCNSFFFLVFYWVMLQSSSGWRQWFRQVFCIHSTLLRHWEAQRNGCWYTETLCPLHLVVLMCPRTSSHCVSTIYNSLNSRIWSWFNTRGMVFFFLLWNTGWIQSSLQPCRDKTHYRIVNLTAIFSPTVQL